MEAQNIVDYIEQQYTEEFSEDDICRNFLSQIFRKYMKKSQLASAKKIHQVHFIKFMNRRFELLKENHQFLENSFVDMNAQIYSAWDSLGSILIEQMLNEADNFFDKNIRCNWTAFPHIYLIYDSQSFKILALNKDSKECRERIRKLESLEVGIMKNAAVPMIPERSDLKKKSTLIEYLSMATSADTKSINKIFNDNKYVITLDYALKILQIHERQLGKMPLIIMGETGVGKVILSSFHCFIICF